MARCRLVVPKSRKRCQFGRMKRYDSNKERSVGTGPGQRIAVSSLEDCFRPTVHWSKTGDALRPWRALMGSAVWEIQVNDFPTEPLYTLFVDSNKVGDFDDWPPAWKR